MENDESRMQEMTDIVPRGSLQIYARPSLAGSIRLCLRVWGVAKGLFFGSRGARPYTAITSRSGSIGRSRLSIPASVPEIELGQLPHAPW